MYSCKLYVLRYGIGNNLALVCNCVKLNLFCILNKLAYHNRVLLGDICRKFEELLQLVGIGADIHCCAGEHVGWAHQHREAYILHKFVDVCHSGKLFPSWLVYGEFVYNRGEFVSILCIVYGFCGGAKKVYSGGI